MDKKSFFHDHGYKYLFSNPTLVRYLITSFVKEEWVKEVDFTRMEKLDKEFISEEYQKRESDIIYKVRYQGSDAYIFLLIEFQSRVDRFMALRVLHYICKLYLDILERNKYKLLPPVFPVILYNGDEQWTAPIEFSDLIEERGRVGLDAYIPRFQYHKIAENEFSKASLIEINNLVSVLFYIEKSSKMEITQAIDRIAQIIMNEQDQMAVSRFVTWIKNFVERKQLKDDEGVMYHFTNPSEVKNMLATTLEEIRLEGKEEGKEEGKREGKEEGKKEGKKEGKREGIVELIKVYLITRFDNAPEDFFDRLKKIEDIQELENAASQIYQCQNLAEVTKLL